MLSPEHAGIPSRTDGPSEQPTSATRSHVYVNVSKSACTASFLPVGKATPLISRELSGFPKHVKVKVSEENGALA